MNPDEHIAPETRRFQLDRPFALEQGDALAAVEVAYRTWGRLDHDGGNAVVVCHALTGSADADRWWPGLVGPGRALDPGRDFVLCSTVLGGCYGTTGPLARDPATGERYGPDFPDVTVRDMVRLQMRLLDHLGVRRVRLALGGSLGGLQALEWALLDPGRVEAVAPIASSARHSAWCIGWSEAQRQALAADPDWREGRYDLGRPPAAGLAAARMIAMCTYRSPASFAARFGRDADGAGFAVEGWLRHHGDLLVRRFDANAYVTLTRAMDSHDVGRGRGDWRAALGSIRQPALVVTIPSDVLYLPAEQAELARHLPRATLTTLPSPHGHDGFLIDVEALDRLLVGFRAGVERGRPAAPRALEAAP